MRRLRITLSTCAVFLLVLVGAAMDGGRARAAEVGTWALQESAGEVRLVRDGIAPVALTVGDRLAGGDWIETGPDGRALLVHAQDTILVAPNSRMGLPRDNSGPFATRILQTLGTILLTVERQARQHFEVETPLLAAVVKGTTFTVSVQGDRALVHVVEGLVEVRDLALGEKGLVRPGETGSVQANGSGVEIFGAGRSPVAPATDDGTQTRAGGTGEGSRQAEASGAASAPGGAPVGTAPKVLIRQALGAEPLDVRSATGGLVRHAQERVANAGDRAAAALRTLAKDSNEALTAAATLTPAAGATATRASAGLAPAAMTGSPSLSGTPSTASARAVTSLSAAPSVAGPITGGTPLLTTAPIVESSVTPVSTVAPSSGGGLLAPLVETVATTTAPVVSAAEGVASGLGLP